MSLLIITCVASSGIFLGKYLFSKWINHLTIYSFIMGGLIFLYELKLLPYPNIIPLAWFFVISSYLSFVFGILTITSARKIFNRESFAKKDIDFTLKIFNDEGKTLRNALIFFSLIAFFVAIQRWWVLLNMFGSITSVLINAAVVYRLNVNREIEDFIPIIPAFVYVAIFLSGIYTAYRKKFGFLTFFPFVSIILKELTYFGRAELLLCLIEFFFSFFLFRHLLNSDEKKRFSFSKGNALFASALLIALVVTTASFVRLSRGAYENYLGASRQLKSMKENLIISPSVYLYLSSDIGVFSKYLQLGDKETQIGENTFYIGYVFLSKFGIVKYPEFFLRGYHIPMWTNTGTYLRELHMDFGLVGMFFIPFLIGLISTWLWFKFYEQKSLITFAFLVYFNLIIGFSFLTMVTKLNQWYISLFFIVISLPIIEKIANNSQKL